MTDLDNLIQNVQDFFQNKYGADTGSLGPGSLFLAFEKLGTVISPGDFKLLGGTDFNPALVLQHGSAIADFAAQLDPDGFVLPRGDLSPKVTAEYDELLSGASYLSASSSDPGLQSFLQLKGRVRRAFDESEASMAPAFWPANFTPQDWFNDQDSGIWSTYSYSTGDGAQPTGTSSTPSGSPKVVLGDWKWRVVTPELTPNWKAVSTLQAVHSSEVSKVLARSVVRSPGAWAVTVAGPASTAALRLAPDVGTAHVEAAPGLSAAIESATSAQPAFQHPPMTPILTKSAVLSTFVLTLPAQHVSSKNFNLSFDYCVANVSRPWLSATFLEAARWYLPGEQSGSRAGGRYESKAYPFAFLPAALVIVKNLSITADWSEEDLAYANNAASLGPFALVDKHFEGQSLKSSGMQIFAWLFQVMPVMPPVSDPSLTTPTSPGG